jgi:KaiC/GvpD/RAD55 family RecA-like ATPase
MKDKGLHVKTSKPKICINLSQISNDAISDEQLDRRFTPTGIETLDNVLGGGFPRNSLIVLTGNPGTGKTVFSASFLYRGVVDYGENGVYVSFAESRKAFHENMKAFGFNFKSLESAGKFRFLDLLTVKEDVVPLVTDFIVDEVDKVKAKRLVLDSYSALAQAFKSPFEARIFIHTVLSKLIRNMGCTILLIKEASESDGKNFFEPEEFVADGVIRLSATELENRRLRSLEILKLRGTRLEKPKLVFTLDGGFKVFESFELKPPEKNEPFQPPSDLPSKYSMGSKDMDNVVGGGIPESSFMILECDEKVPISAVPVLLHPMTASFALKGRGAIIAPSCGVNYATLSEFLKLYGVTPENCKRSLRVVIMGKNMETAESCEYEIVVDGENWEKDLETVLKTYEHFASEVGRPILSMVCAATLATLYGDERCLEILKTAAAQAKNAGAILIAIIGAGYRDLAIKLSLLADFYFRLTRKHGCLILYGVKPRTLLYAVEADTSKGYPTAKLAPIL